MVALTSGLVFRANHDDWSGCGHVIGRWKCGGISWCRGVQRLRWLASWGLFGGINNRCGRRPREAFREQEAYYHESKNDSAHDDCNPPLAAGTMVRRVVVIAVIYIVGSWRVRSQGRRQSEKIDLVPLRQEKCICGVSSQGDECKSSAPRRSVISQCHGDGKAQIVRRERSSYLWCQGGPCVGCCGIGLHDHGTRSWCGGALQQPRKHDRRVVWDVEGVQRNS